MQDKQISSEKFMSLRNVFTTAAERYTLFLKKNRCQSRAEGRRFLLSQSEGITLTLRRASRVSPSTSKASAELPRNGRFSSRYRDESAESVAVAVIRRRNIERNKRAINAKHQTTLERRYRLASVGRARARNRSTASSVEAELLVSPDK